MATVEPAQPDTVEHLQEIVPRHLDRFAFREAPQPFGWMPA